MSEGATPPPSPTPTLVGEKSTPTRFYVRRELDSVRAIRDLQVILENITGHLGRVDKADIGLIVEVEATSHGFDDQVRRTVSENAAQLGFETYEFEE